MGLKSKGIQLLAPSLHWIGISDAEEYLQVNIYTLVRKENIILFDPGPAVFFSETRQALEEATGSNLPDIIILSHQDPDVCSSLPLWFEAGFKGWIFAHWKTAILLPAFCEMKNVVAIGGNENIILPADNLSLDFIPSPYLHSPGALNVYDRESKTLFSGDLFGSPGKTDRLYFDEEQMERMVSFHELYMPSTELLNNHLNELKQLDIQLICPQHGTVIREGIDLIFTMLEQAKCGKVAPELLTYREQKDKEIHELLMDNFDLKKNMVLYNDGKILDKATGLYNHVYFNSYFPLFLEGNPQGYCVYFRLDGMKQFNEDFGFSEGDSAISVLTRILIREKRDDAMIFRANGPILSMLIPGLRGEELEASLLGIQKAVKDSDEFIAKMSCSIAAVPLSELTGVKDTIEKELKKAMLERLKILDREGENSLCLSLSEESSQHDRTLIMIIDSDRVNGLFLKDFFERRGYATLVCNDGGAALHLIDMNRPDLIISEVHISPADAFQLRTRLLESGDLKNIPFLLMSHLKSEIFIRRAFQLSIYHYLKKPVSLVELEGIASFLTEKKYDS